MHQIGTSGRDLGHAALQQRLRDVSGLSLNDILAADRSLITLSSPLRRLLKGGAARELFQAREEWAARLASGMVKYLTDEFQFVDLRAQREPLEGMYLRLIDGLAHDEPEKALVGHHDRLRAWTTAQLAAVNGLELVRMTGFRPVCGHYSPQLQLQVLGITADELDGPVLDLGCGDGALVRHLVALGHSAVGIDRNAPVDMMAGEWFEAPLTPGYWGTIIAHQSVSLHFLHAHLRSRRLAAEYARFYMQILRALRPGGRFVYAPSLPFFEPMLPGDYGMTHVMAFPGAESTLVTRLR